MANRLPMPCHPRDITSYSRMTIRGRRLALAHTRQRPDQPSVTTAMMSTPLFTSDPLRLHHLTILRPTSAIATAVCPNSSPHHHLRVAALYLIHRGRRDEPDLWIPRFRNHNQRRIGLGHLPDGCSLSELCKRHMCLPCSIYRTLYSIHTANTFLIRFPSIPNI